MKKEITNEVRARIAGMYIGCQAQWSDERNDEFPPQVGALVQVDPLGVGILLKGGTMAECSFHECKFILRPLSAITDEDAIEVAKICGIDNPEVRHRDYDTECLGASVEVSRKGLAERVLQISKHDGSISLTSNGLYRVTAYQGEVFQYLISKGYALPLLALGGLTPIAANLALDATLIKTK